MLGYGGVAVSTAPVVGVGVGVEVGVEVVTDANALEHSKLEASSTSRTDMMVLKLF